MLQIHPSATLFKICVYECLMNMNAKFYLPTMFKSYLNILKHVQVTKSSKYDNIHKHALNKNFNFLACLIAETYSTYRYN